MSRRDSLTAKMAALQVPSSAISQFSPQELETFKESFANFDADGSGSIDAIELGTIIQQLGEPCPDKKTLNTLIAEVDADNSGQVEFGEFLSIVGKVRDGATSGFAGVVNKANKVYQVKGMAGSLHSFSEEEKAAFSEHINFCLGKDSECADLLPIDPDSMDLFKKVDNGLILSKLINLAVPDTIDERALNKKKGMNLWHKTENMNLVVNAAKGIGCSMVNIGALDLMAGKEVLILGLIWQIVKMQLLADITLDHNPFLIRLLNDGEELSDLQNLSPEELLLRWFNYHLKEAGSDRRVHNFGKDVKDSECYSILLHQLDAKNCDLVKETDATQRAQHVIDNAKKMGVPAFIHKADIVKGNTKLNLAFVAQIFNTCPGLTATEEEQKEFDDFAAMDHDDGDSREERIFRMWLNSLGLDGIYINSLFGGDLADGLVILKAMDKIEPGIVHWKKVNLKRPVKIKFKKVENCNYAVVLGKQMNFSLVNVGGIDVVDGNKKLILSIIWQLMRYHTIKILSSLSGDGSRIDDKDIIQWANNKTRAGGFSTRMRDFKDRSLGDGVFLLDLLTAMKPQSVNREICTAGANDEDAKNNARYAISIARKIGATVFLTWEDIVEVKSKMIMTFCGCMMAVDKSGQTSSLTSDTAKMVRKMSQAAQIPMGNGAELWVEGDLGQGALTGSASNISARKGSVVGDHMEQTKAVASPPVAPAVVPAPAPAPAPAPTPAPAPVSAAAVPVEEAPTKLSGESERQVLTDGIALLTQKDGDAGIIYKVENSSDINIEFSVDFTGSQNLELKSGGLEKDTRINTGSTEVVGEIYKVDGNKGYSLRMNMGLQQVE